MSYQFRSGPRQQPLGIPKWGVCGEIEDINLELFHSSLEWDVCGEIVIIDNL